MDEETSIHRNTNFQSFQQSLLVLFRAATGEAWQGLFYLIRLLNVIIFISIKLLPSEFFGSGDVLHFLKQQSFFQTTGAFKSDLKF